MNILVINAGSSSLKYQLIESESEECLAKGLCERIGLAGSNIEQKAGGKVLKKELPLTNHVDAFAAVIDALTGSECGVISSLDAIDAVGHRVVHGGESFASSVVIDDDVMKALRDNIPLAPLHNPANITGIEACKAVMPNVPMVGVFDTAFHQTMPRQAYLYALPYDLYERLKVRRYGFHGTSHAYVANRTAEILGKPLGSLKIIVCHMGNGASITAVKYGKSVDTSMGMTPLEGLVMGTRSGDFDPAIAQSLVNRDGLSVDDAFNVFNKKSGLLGLTGGKYADWRDVKTAAQNGEDEAIRATEVFAYRVKKYIGAYIAAMNGVDAIAFTAGIGENDSFARSIIIKDMEALGIKLDASRNNVRGEALISSDDSKVKVYVVPTNEELAIARDTARLVAKK